ncbi:MAG TPA: ribosome maturation factor RimP [Facklamia tabacinasalis]|uniref:Ribosome maturation factor RimP n=1 Tax=Ruoffia tabacinasalis TaxID=87458 RepID=A0A5R9EKG5_9LACT|nr:ribosome maturation factor RimP [Ruoffia tabacinasalis]TLQ49583.1 ribosome maturation factor RimP [Ruoffia tabacinasalis]HJG47843.1 ribosome maturation factor RimP [Ruoffia tabacinasalis]
MSKVIESVVPVIEPIVESENCYLVDVEYVKEGPNWYLRVYADKENGIDIEDCAKISEKLSEALDQISPDPFPKAYFLEVSSPGAERPLKTEKDILNAVGEYIHLDYYVPQFGEKFHEGTLLEVTDGIFQIEVTIKTRKKVLEIKRDAVSKLRLAIKF